VRPYDEQSGYRDERTLKHRGDITKRTPSRSSTWVYVAGAAAAVALLLAVRFGVGGDNGGTIFHILVELVSIVIATGTFMVAWNARRYSDNDFLLFLGIAFLFVGSIDALHTLAYNGMGPKGAGVFPGYDTDLPTTFWVAGRYLQALALLIAPVFLTRRVRAWPTFWALGSITGVSIALVFAGALPTTYVVGQGLTTFKVVSEAVIAGLLLVSLIHLRNKREHIDGTAFELLQASIVLTVAGELAFSLYVDVFGALNILGHILRLFAYFALYRAVIVSSLARPLDVMFRDLTSAANALAESEERFRTTFEQASIGIAHISLDGRWLRMNRRLLEITGYAPGEMEHLSYREVTHPDDLVLEERLVERLTSDEIDQYRIEKRYIQKSGAETWVNVNRTLLRNDNGEPLYFVAIIEDVSSRKAAEQDLQRTADLNIAVNEVDIAVNSTLNISDTLSKACIRTAQGLGADSSVITMHEGEVWVARYAYRFPTDIRGRSFTDDTVPHAILAARLGEPVAIDDAFNDVRVNREIMVEMGVRSVLAVPLSLHDRHLGTLYLNFHGRRHHFNENEIDFGRKIATSLTLAIENAYLYESERVIAEILQNAVLAMPDALPGATLAHAYRSAEELARIGGDFYDAFTVSDALIGFVIGDVSGKGLSAATLTATARSTIRAFAHMGEAPATVLAKANNAIHEQIDESKFITAIYGTLDTSTGRVELACAGHPTPLFLRNGQCIREHVESRPPLGVVPGQLYEQFTCVLEPGEIILLFSDGLLDARGEHGFLAESGVCAIVERVGDVPPATMVENLIESAEEYAGGRINDDVTIVAIRYTGSQPT
jgi:PAS domain S-box-containing protein